MLADYQEWKPISRSRLCKEHSSGFFLIVPSNKKTVAPLCCSVCDLVMRDSDDSLSFKEFGACSWCALKWAEPNRKKWDEGWRPDSSEVEKEVTRRQEASIRLPSL